MQSRRDIKELVCDLTEDEQLARARTCATATEELVRLDRVKKDWNTAHNEQVKAQAGLASRMSDCVRTGREKRLVECLTEFHKPNVGMKTTVRLDTGEIVGEPEAMSRVELQENLFEDPATAVPQSAVDEALKGIAMESGAKSTACESGLCNHCTSEQCVCGCHGKDATEVSE